LLQIYLCEGKRRAHLRGGRYNLLDDPGLLGLRLGDRPGFTAFPVEDNGPATFLLQLPRPLDAKPPELLSHTNGKIGSGGDVLEPEEE